MEEKGEGKKGGLYVPRDYASDATFPVLILGCATVPAFKHTGWAPSLCMLDSIKVANVEEHGGFVDCLHKKIKLSLRA